MGLFEPQFTRKPDRYPKAQEFYQVMWDGNWNSKKFGFDADYQQFFHVMTTEERGVFIRNMAMIAQIEVAIKKFWGRLGDHLPHPSINDLGYVMADIEVRHNVAYEKVIEKLGMNDVFEEMFKEPVVANRVKYLRKYLERHYSDDRKQFVYSIILFTLFVENVSLFSQFYIGLWFKKFKDLMPDTAQQIEYTRNEENTHANVGIWLINTLKEEYPDLFDEELRSRIENEMREAFNAEGNIIDWILQGYSGEQLDADLLKEYIGSRMAISMEAIGYEFKHEVTRADELLWLDEEIYGYNAKDFFAGKDKNYGLDNKTYNEEDVFGD